MKLKKIAVFYGGKITRHLVLIREAARKLGVGLDLISYNRVSFETTSGRVTLRGQDVGDYDVLFFRTTGKHWEEVDLLVASLSSSSRRKPVIVDPMVEWGKPSMAGKAWQMMKLTENKIPVPKTVYGSLWYLHEYMKSQITNHKLQTNLKLQFPIILKGSGGDRGTRVFRANNLEELEKLVRDLRKSETEEGKRYMLQEWIENEGDYRVLVLGKKVLGVMRRTRDLKSGEFRNNFSMGGRVEVADLPTEVKQMAMRAAEACGLMIAGVDIIKSTPDPSFEERRGEYMVLEVNKGPQFWGFMKATNIDVPLEIVRFLVSLKPNHS